MKTKSPVLRGFNPLPRRCRIAIVRSSVCLHQIFFADPAGSMDTPACTGFSSKIVEPWFLTDFGDHRIEFVWLAAVFSAMGLEQCRLIRMAQFRTSSYRENAVFCLASQPFSETYAVLCPC